MVSLNGWVLEHFHSIPKAGDSFEYEDLKITVLASEHRRIALLEVERESQEEPNTQQEGVSS